MKLNNSLLLLGAFGAVVSILPATVSAQEGQGAVPRLENIPNQVATDYEVKVLRVRNVKASIVAYWLDPIHNEMPPAYRQSADLRAQVQGVLWPSEVADSAAKVTKWQTRFPGLQAVTPQDAQNQLLVVGTPESFAKVEAELAVLDKPLRQVEVTAQFVETNPENINALGLKHLNLGPNNRTAQTPDMAMGNGGAEVDEKIKTLVAEGKAKLASTHRVTLISGLYGSIGMGSALPAAVGIKDENGRFHELNSRPGGTNSPQLLLDLQSKLLAKATVNKDETILLEIHPSRKLNLSVSKPQAPLQTTELLQPATPEISLRSTAQPQVATTIRDGDAVALSGITYAGSVQDVMTDSKDKNVILIVTARIIRRLNDAAEN